MVLDLTFLQTARYKLGSSVLFNFDPRCHSSSVLFLILSISLVVSYIYPVSYIRPFRFRAKPLSSLKQTFQYSILSISTMGVVRSSITQL